MPIRFAAAGSGECMAVRRVLQAKRPSAPANDGEALPDQIINMVSTLKHFGAYGLSAAHRAAQLAQQARKAGDMCEYRHWLGICAQLDGRLAKRLAAQHRRR
jgi:hypothetical protein